MRKHAFAAAFLLLSLLISIPAFSQGGLATVTGSVTDSSGALTPGVTFTVKAVDTGRVQFPELAAWETCFYRSAYRFDVLEFGDCSEIRRGISKIE